MEFLAVAFFAWALPILLILFSDRVSGKEKAIWVFCVLFVSWFAWILYLFIAPVIPREYTNHY